ncbi:hypothetical protein [Halobacillus sp. A5]|uniref:hypothetical protein n=1 Tax=Halobacillus sp. A5 TaxID=2880263 RepID=UPI0020A6433D|nr:hypothetical protein [Halobacillus sp. A5]MCP3026608.1 hypothetical protein [Halobacillus sp. A5]
MPTFIANNYLVKDGKVVSPGREIEITEEQAARLGDKVKDAPSSSSNTEGDDGSNKHTETSLKKLSAEEQKDLVADLEGDLEELTNEEKRIAYILDKQ